MSIEHTEGLVLKTYDYSETSKIAAVFTRSFGKIKVVAKGAKSKNSKTSAIMEPGSYVKIVFYHKTDSELYNLSEAAIIDQFSGIRLDIVRFAYFMYIIELVDALFEHDERAGAFFDILISFVKKIEGDNVPELYVRALEVKILDILGHRLQLDKCVECGKPVPQNLVFDDVCRLFDGKASSRTPERRFNLSIRHGGLLCKGCSHKDSKPVKCSVDFIQIFHCLCAASADEISKLKLSGGQLEELKNILRNAIDFLLGKGLKSLNFLEKALKGIADCRFRNAE